jgi:adenylate cyclase
VTAGATGNVLRVERRFLLPSLPRPVTQGKVALIEEHYLRGTGMTLRRTMSAGRAAELTLGQQVRSASDRTARVTLTERLTPHAYGELAKLPADVLVWRRYDAELSGWPCVVHVFEGELHGLVLAQATFPSRTEAWRFPRPVYAVAEVTGDDRLAEPALARTSAAELARLVAEYGMLLR